MTTQLFPNSLFGNNGLLRIDLARELPDALKPRRARTPEDTGLISTLQEKIQLPLRIRASLIRCSCLPKSNRFGEAG